MSPRPRRRVPDALAPLLLLAVIGSTGCASQLERGAEAATKRHDWPLAYASWDRLGLKYVGDGDEDAGDDAKFARTRAKAYEALEHWFDDERPRLERLAAEGRFEAAYGAITTFAHEGRFHKPFTTKITPLYDKIVLGLMSGKADDVPVEKVVGTVAELESLLLDAPEGSVALAKLSVLKEREAKRHLAVYEDPAAGKGRRALHGRLAERYGGKSLPSLSALQDAITPRFVVRSMTRGCDAIVSEAVAKVFPERGGSGEPVPLTIDLTCEQREASQVAREKRTWEEQVMDRRTTSKETCTTKSTYIGTTTTTERHGPGTTMVRSEDVVAKTDSCKTSSSTSDVGMVSVPREAVVQVKRVTRNLNVTGSITAPGGRSIPIRFQDTSTDEAWSEPGGHGKQLGKGRELRMRAATALAADLVSARAAATGSTVKAHVERAEAAERDGKEDIADDEWALAMFASGGPPQGAVRWLTTHYGLEEPVARTLLTDGGNGRKAFVAKPSPLAYALKVPTPPNAGDDDDDD